jgi:serine/threonine-protein kinase
MAEIDGRTGTDGLAEDGIVAPRGSASPGGCDPGPEDSRVLALAGAFQEAWPAAIEDFLPAGAGAEPGVRFRALVALSHIDLELRWRAGEEARAVDYLARDPEAWRADREAALDLIAAEYELRAERLRPEAFVEGCGAWGEGLAGRLQARHPEDRAASRYRNRRLHRSGGLGDVYLADDEQLGRPVALKRIQARHRGHPRSRRQFLFEARVTGRLEHPGIVPVYSLDREDDGEPAYAMRFVVGESLKEAVERFHRPAAAAAADPRGRNLALRDLLGRFVSACRTVSYAHSHGVLHCDLKPANIMIGPFGEALVVDWGLARLFDPADGDGPPPGAGRPPAAADLDPGWLGLSGGTPGYASPEQALGPGMASPRSDVYSLGATLYSLLTGAVPVPATPAPDGREAAPAGVPRALLAVCRKAMADRPEGRYESARALADDVERWLADESVAAWPDPFPTRARRWARRHRVAVGAGAAALLVGLLGLGSTAAVLAGKNRELGVANVELTRANAALDRQFRRAEAHEALAIAAVKRFRDAVAGDPVLKQNPALHDLRMRLLGEPLAFFRALRDRLQADGDTRPEALARLASAGFDLSVLTAEIGDAPDAIAALRVAATLWQKLADDHPEVALHRHDLASAHNNLSLLLRATGRRAEAMAAHEAAVALQRRLADDHPHLPAPRVELARSRHNLGLLRYEAGDLPGAQRDQEAALALQRALDEAHPGTPAYRRELAATLHSLGGLRRARGDATGAAAAFEEAVAIRRALADAEADVPEHRHDLAKSLHSLGALRLAAGATPRAREAFDAALALQRELAAAYPAITSYRSELARSLNDLGILLSEAGDPRGALAAHAEALTFQRKLADDHPDIVAYHSDLGAIQNNIGLRRQEVGDAKGAAAAHAEALGIRRTLADAHPEVAAHRRDLAVSHYNLANLRMATGDAPGARVAFEAALDIQRKLADESPGVASHRSLLARIYNNLGSLQLDAGDEPGARAAFEAAVGLQRELADLQPGSPEPAYILACTLGNLAQMDLEARRFDAARDRLEEGIRWQRNALEARPNHPDYRQAIETLLGNLVAAATALGRGDEAADARIALVAYRASDPRFAALDARLAAVLGSEAPADNAERLALAQRAYETGRYATAARLWGEALDGDPALGEDRQSSHRYNASCAAALAASARSSTPTEGGKPGEMPVPNGRTAAGPGLDDDARARLRQRALGWLSAELATWAKVLRTQPTAGPFVAQALRYWQIDPDLAGLRDATALQGLSEGQRAACRDLWCGVADLLRDATFPAEPFARDP